MGSCSWITSSRKSSVIFVVSYKLAKDTDVKLPEIHIHTRMGNRQLDERRSDRCEYVADGFAEFIWRMRWNLMEPSMELNTRLKSQIVDDISTSRRDDQVYATVDINLCSLFDENCVKKKPI